MRYFTENKILTNNIANKILVLFIENSTYRKIFQIQNQVNECKF